jgi:hypothetical protein
MGYGAPEWAMLMVVVPLALVTTALPLATFVLVLLTYRKLNRLEGALRGGPPFR